MSQLKTQRTDQSPEAFIRNAAEGQKQEDCFSLVEIMQKASGAEPRMWGPSIVGFGDYTYKYPDGRSLDWFYCGFSPRKANIALYIMGAAAGRRDLLSQLGKYKTGKSCMYIQRISDINPDILEKLIRESVDELKRQ